MKHKIEVYPAKDGWRFRVVAHNGNIVADSGEAYTRKASALRAARRLPVIVASAVIVVGGEV